MTYFLAFLPILLVLGLMVFLRWGGQQAGPAGWAGSILIALLFFGLNWNVLWVSQLKGFFLSLFVLAILWPALFLYNVVEQIGGIRAIALGLQRAIGAHGLLLITLAWAFSSMLEGLAGFGLPIAIVSPMLVALGVPAIQAVAAVAVGHAWSVTFGDMSVIIQTLSALVHLPVAVLAPLSALFLGITCIACGLGAALILKQMRYAPVVILLGVLMATIQYLLALTPLVPLAVLIAGLAGVGSAVLLGKRMRGAPATVHSENPGSFPSQPVNKVLIAGMSSYAGLALLLALVFIIDPLRNLLQQLAWQIQFPATLSNSGFSLPAAVGQILRPLTHPGTYLLLVALMSFFVYRLFKLNPTAKMTDALASTWRSAAPVSAGIFSMVGLSMVMEHCGMTQLLAEGLAKSLGAFFPLVSPAVGVLGAFATGSNNNSNVLFASLQYNVAQLLKINPLLLLASQTAGGALGSMIAPAKIIVGCSTTGVLSRDGEVIRQTLRYCLAIGVGLGILAWLLSVL